MGDQYYDPQDEQEEARRRIEEIKGGGAAPPPRRQETSDDYSDLEAADDFENDAVTRARSRVSATRARLGLDDHPPAPEPRRRMRAATSPEAAGTARSRQALMLIGGVVGAGILVVLVIVFAAGMFGGANPLARATSTPTATFTPLATETPTATATRQAPQLALPPLTCIFQSGTGCRDYCAAADNTSECNAARDFIRAQGADPDAWFQCLSPASGPNQGNPQECLRQAWFAANP